MKESSKINKETTLIYVAIKIVLDRDTNKNMKISVYVYWFSSKSGHRPQ